MEMIPQQPFIYAALYQMCTDANNKPHSPETEQSQVLPYLRTIIFHVNGNRTKLN